MGYLEYRINLGTSIVGPEGKKRLVAGIARMVDIMYTSAIHTINMKAEDPMDVSYRVGTSILNKSLMALDEDTVNDLINAENFTVRVVIRKAVVTFTYDRNVNQDNSCYILIKLEFREYMHKYMFGFVLDKNLQASQAFYDIGLDRVERLKDLVYTVFKKYLADSFYASIQKVTVNKFQRDSVYLNFLGFIFTIRRRI